MQTSDNHATLTLECLGLGWADEVAQDWRLVENRWGAVPVRGIPVDNEGHLIV
jgi:hypothetical protein